MITIPVDLLTRNWDKEAAETLTLSQLEKYFEKTEEARKDWAHKFLWAKHQAIYEHSSNQAVVRRHPWRQLEAKAASHFLEYQQTLWAVLMSLRVRADKPVVAWRELKVKGFS